jgi:hypothetical protein
MRQAKIFYKDIEAKQLTETNDLIYQFRKTSKTGADKNY